jgi:hypothetical protein
VYHCALPIGTPLYLFSITYIGSKPLSRLEGGPEKAGVGGSIPSLATTPLNNLGSPGENASPAFHPHSFAEGNSAVDEREAYF